ncbi:hypothetical protein [Labilibaculum antarcticum]|uniref:hypothetical protein n=1 Tax=Labilibaculum antarcticum TaxID=1717717 RepID=UPI000BBAC9D7|nr:hypothetical protein [Labilibaculum antarcticum]
MFLKHKMVSVFTLLPFISLLYQDKPEFHVVDALGSNYNLSSWKDGQKEQGGNFGYDVFRVNAKAKYKGVKLNAEYRFLFGRLWRRNVNASLGRLRFYSYKYPSNRINTSTV